MESGKLTFGELRNYLGTFGFRRRLFDVDTNECRVFEETAMIPETYNDKYVINIKLSEKPLNRISWNDVRNSSADIYLSEYPKETVENNMPDYDSGEITFGELMNYFDSSVRLFLELIPSDRVEDRESAPIGSKDILHDIFNDLYVIVFSKGMEGFHKADVPEVCAEGYEENDEVLDNIFYGDTVVADCMYVLLSDCPKAEYYKKMEEAFLGIKPSVH